MKIFPKHLDSRQYPLLNKTQALSSSDKQMVVGFCREKFFVAEFILSNFFKGTGTRILEKKTFKSAITEIFLM